MVCFTVLVFPTISVCASGAKLAAQINKEAKAIVCLIQLMLAHLSRAGQVSKPDHVEL